MAFYFARIWLTDSAAKLVLIAAVLVAKISAANSSLYFTGYGLSPYYITCTELAHYHCPHYNKTAEEMKSTAVRKTAVKVR